MGDFFGAIFDEIRYMRLLYPALLLLALWGALRAGERRSAKPAGTALVLLLLLSWRPFSWTLNALLEGSYETGGAPPAEVGAVVVFSGASFPPQSGQPFSFLDSGTNLRCREAAEAYAKLGRPPVVVCGRSTIDVRDADSVWDLMSRQLQSWGVPETRIRIESRGASTYQQALYAAEMLREMGVQRVAVVTEGYHMRRAAGCLKRQGFETVAAPAGTRGFPDEIEWRDFVPSPQAEKVSEEALREMLALVFYKVAGRI
jgi:uncharacterized SAM-binding protein YcdF (DUF218 family)